MVIEESKYGAVTSNGSSTFNGMIGKVQRNEADIAVADFLKTLSRSEVVDFASQLYFVRFVLLRTSDKLVAIQLIYNPFSVPAST